tara:strand:- start:23 stop:967 length:945 start_codon:yes stop_codon:yes gene_type:complete
MKKYKLFFYLFITVNFLNINLSFSAIETSLVAKVGDRIISSYELKNKIKTLLFLNNQELNQSNINIAKNQALRVLIDNKIKEEEIDKYKLSFKNDDLLNKNLQNIASNYNTDVKGLVEIFNNNGLNYELYAKEITTNLLWNNLIFELYGEKINLNDNEVEKEIQDVLKNNNDLVEYKLAEIELRFENENEKNKKIANIKEQIQILGFENSAKKFSVSSTAQSGGNIGWINSKSLSEQISQLMKDMKPGDVTKPILRPNNVLLLKLIEKKRVNLNKENLTSLRKKIINQKKSEYLDLFANNHLLKIRNNKFIEIK